jgi:hypothetical protein
MAGKIGCILRKFWVLGHMYHQSRIINYRIELQEPLEKIKTSRAA